MDQANRTLPPRGLVPRGTRLRKAGQIGGLVPRGTQRRVILLIDGQVPRGTYPLATKGGV